MLLQVLLPCEHRSVCLECIKEKNYGILQKQASAATGGAKIRIKPKPCPGKNQGSKRGGGGGGEGGDIGTCFDCSKILICPFDYILFFFISEQNV